MKKYLLLLIGLLIYSALSAQRLDSARVVERAKSYFKDVFVEKEFKDPYSYELLKVIAQPYTAKDKVKLELASMEILDLGDDPVGAYRELVAKKNLTEYNRVEKYYLQALTDYELVNKSTAGKISQLDSLKSIINSHNVQTIRINEYGIEIQCYVTDNLGNKVLGKYAFFIDVFGNVKSKPTKIN